MKVILQNLHDNCDFFSFFLFSLFVFNLFKFFGVSVAHLLCMVVLSVAYFVVFFCHLIVLRVKQ